MSARKEKYRKELFNTEIHLPDCQPDKNGKPVALVYPDSYEVGMSSLGYLTVYRYLVEAGFKPERFFFNIRNSNNVPVSIETAATLKKLQTIAFHFSFELDYINALKMLIDSGIETSRKKREKSGGNFLIAGGMASTANPLPLVKFMDAVFIGELENEYVNQIENACVDDDTSWFLSREFEDSNGNYRVRQNQNNNWADSSSFSPIITPHSVFSMTNLIEITRGCPVKCKFCLAGNIRQKTSERPLSLILEDALRHENESKKIGLIGAIPSLHSSIMPLLENLLDKGMKPSLSALSVNSLKSPLLDLLAKSGMKTLTLGVETFDEEVQRSIGKIIKLDGLLNRVEYALKSGMREIKLYLMLGLPDAADNEENLLIKRTLEINKLAQSARPGSRTTISLNPFIPKIATPYERKSFMGEKTFRKKVRMIRAKLAKEGINVISESHRGSFIQHLISCGDEVIGDIILRLAVGESINQLRNSLPDDLDAYLNETASKVSKTIFRN